MRRFLLVGLSTFVVTAVVAWGSNRALSVVDLIPSILFLIVIILIGVAFDILGTAATAADEAPFHAMSVDRVPGAPQAAWLVRNADRVANFSNDFIGDICGTVSGAVSATIALRILEMRPDVSEAGVITLLLALTAALTVGAKAWGKGIAVRRAHEILATAGRWVSVLESITGVELLRRGNHGRSRRQARRRRRPRK